MRARDRIVGPESRKKIPRPRYAMGDLNLWCQRAIEVEIIVFHLRFFKKVLNWRSCKRKSTSEHFMIPQFMCWTAGSFDPSKSLICFQVLKSMTRKHHMYIHLDAKQTKFVANISKIQPENHGNLKLTFWARRNCTMHSRTFPLPYLTCFSFHHFAHGHFHAKVSSHNHSRCKLIHARMEVESFTLHATNRKFFQILISVEQTLKNRFFPSILRICSV